MMAKFKLKYIVLGIILIMLVSFGKAVQLQGSCSSVSYQCDLSVNDLQVCNNSPYTDTFTASATGDVANWVNIIPETFTLAPNECRQLHAYTVAECYADPGDYTATITVRDKSSASVTCNIKIEQGHRVGVEILPESQQAGQCEERTYKVRLTNNSRIANQQTERVGLEVKGMPKEWYTLANSTVYVTKGTPVETDLKVKAPCDAQAGTYGFEAFAMLINPSFYSSDSAQYVLTQGQAVTIEPELGADMAVEACTGKSSTADIRITNTGKLSDRVALSLTGPEGAMLDANTLSLGSGQTKTVHLGLPTLAEGDYSVKVKAKSLEYGNETTSSFGIKVQKCYALSIEKTSGDEKVCAEQMPGYRFRVTNTGTKEISAALSIEGVKAELSKNNVTLAPGASADVDAKLDVSGIATEGEITRREKNIAVEIVMDSSGSMLEKIGSEAKMDIGKRAVKEFVNSAAGAKLGLRVFGQGSGCEQSGLLYAIQPVDSEEISERIDSMAPKGKSPIAEALVQSAADFPEGSENYIVIVSDGKETCNGSMQSAAQTLKEKGIVVYAIGFDIDTEGKAQLQELASQTGGRYFDARDSEELVGVFGQIGVELKIVQPESGEREFSLRAVSPNLPEAVVNTQTIEVQDCYNVVAIAPQLSLCRGIESSSTLEIRNLGSTSQQLRVAVKPSWIATESSLTLEPNSAKTMPLTARPPANATDAELSVDITGQNAEAHDSAAITYLGSAACFGINITNPYTILDANACEGRVFKITLENIGAVEQSVELSVNKPWVYLDEEKLTLAKNERKDVFFLISPPYDLREEETTIVISAKTDHGFETDTTIKLNIFGADFGLHEVETRITDISALRLGDANADVRVEFVLHNDSNRIVKIYSIEPLEHTGTIQAENSLIDRGASTGVVAYLELGDEDSTQQITVPIKLVTDEGTFVRGLEFSLEGTDQVVGMGTGLLGFGNIGAVLVGGLIGLVLVLIGFALTRKPKAGAAGIAMHAPDSKTAAASQPQTAELAKFERAKAKPQAGAGAKPAAEPPKFGKAAAKPAGSARSIKGRR